MGSRTASLSLVGGSDAGGFTSQLETASKENLALHQNLYSAYELLQKKELPDQVKQVLSVLQKIAPVQEYYEGSVNPEMSEEEISNHSSVSNPPNCSMDDMDKKNDGTSEKMINRLNATIGVGALIVAVLSFISYLQITATQSIRDETKATATAILVETKASNEKVINELQSLRGDMQGLKSEINQKLEIQEMKIENKFLKEKLNDKK